ncbi:hypothetical protein [Campylobacter sp. RM9328]|uniref:hypothetical protein n=1 Tax=Campylobacter sp. RM9328 TaxID=1705720 RepID=UPI0014727EE9|nr:hypothetical protein [Campylobacter sp. RM9328]
MTKEEIQLELTKLILSTKKPQISGDAQDAVKPIVEIYKRVGELLSSPETKDCNKPSKA